MKHADIVVVGGSAAGLTAAITARRHYPDKSVLVLRKEEQVLIPCGIPYIFGTVGAPEKNLIPDAVLDKNGVDLLVTDVKSLDTEEKALETDTEQVGYQRLILATGSNPAMPPIPGKDLEGVQAGLSWLTVLKKRARYREVFDGLDPEKVARYSGKKIETLLQDPGIIRNRRKVEAAVTNARAFLELQEEQGGFSDWLWGFVDGEPVTNHFKRFEDIPAETDASRRLSRELLSFFFAVAATTEICTLSAL